MITITLQPQTPEQLDAALALLQRIRDEKVASDAEFQKFWKEAAVEARIGATPAVPLSDLVAAAEREPGADEAEAEAEAEDAAPQPEQTKPARRTRKTVAAPVVEPEPPFAAEQPVAETNTSDEPVQTQAENEHVPARVFTLEEVRARLAELSQAGGKKDEVKALLAKHGAVKLTDLDPTTYQAVMADAEAL